MATRYAFSIDLDRCIGCQACAVACQTGNEVPLGDSFIAVSDIVRGQSPNSLGSFAHHRCFHCGDAACVNVCPTGALVQMERADGRRHGQVQRVRLLHRCVPVPGAAHPDNHVSKCIACLGTRSGRSGPGRRAGLLVQDGQKPWCAQTCPSQAIKFGDRERLLAEAKSRVAAIRSRYPNAEVYGDTQLGGLGLMMILLDQPTVYGLPANPEICLPL